MENKKKLAVIHFIAMAASLGVVMCAHYVYDIWPNLFTSLLFPVNESIWEHSKLFVLPVLLVYLIVYLIIGKKFKNYMLAAGLSTLCMPIAMIIIFQIYLLISPVHHDISGIIASTLILVGAFIFTYRLTIKNKKIDKKVTYIVFASVVLYLMIMALFTYYPPKASWLKWLFMDHENMSYGIIP